MFRNSNFILQLKVYSLTSSRNPFCDYLQNILDTIEEGGDPVEQPEGHGIAVKVLKWFHELLHAVIY